MSVSTLSLLLLSRPQPPADPLESPLWRKQHFYSKTVAIISQARTGEPLQPSEAAGPATDSGADRRTISGAQKTRRINKWVSGGTDQDSLRAPSLYD